MSQQESAQSAPGSAPPKEAPPVTDAYRKAHKSYVLVSGLLAAWELIGVTLHTGDKWGIELKSPSGAPLILFTLVLYSGYKLTIEWLQCDPERRAKMVAKIDYRMAHIIAGIAVAITLDQHIWNIRLVDQIYSRLMISTIFVCIMPTLSWLAWVHADRLKSRPSGIPDILIAILCLSPGIPPLIALAAMIHGINTLAAFHRMPTIPEMSIIVIGSILGLLISVGMVVLYKKLAPPRTNDPQVST